MCYTFYIEHIKCKGQVQVDKTPATLHTKHSFMFSFVGEPDLRAYCAGYCSHGAFLAICQV